jgi:hypothetical protein
VTLSKGLRQRAGVPPTATVTESCRRRHVRSEIMDDFVGLLRACGAMRAMWCWDASSQLADLRGTHRVGEGFSAFRSHGR